ncbi:MAG TPA: NAD(P)-dependent alcohol dehydrogenase [Gemmataceae bacterium]|jgi:NADPH:quinone reductase-like Zn-dependent oxidoreductase|nr:NAD(P)-dependent alcohol dehydrogenase [Gemmataceae bacterium]
MKVYEIRAFGLEGLKLAERPQPQPGPFELLLKVRAASLNYRDLMMLKGSYNPKMQMPRVPLSDAAGEVAAVGPGVSRVKVGQRVAGIFMQKWLAGELTETAARSALAGAIDGVLAEYVVLHESGVVPVPEHLSDEEAATLPCAAVTAWHGLITEGQVTAGDSVLVQGTGGVSLFALQFARLVGARVVITSSSDDKLRRAREMGAAEAINYKATPEWGDRVRELTGGRGVDHIVEVGGAGTLGQSLKAVRTGGRISLIGVLTGGTGQVNPLPVLMKGVRVQGIFVGSREMFEAMNRAIALHKLRPVVDRVFPFAEAVEAYRYLESAAHFGKIVIRVG